jgi:hypothetical protein
MKSLLFIQLTTVDIEKKWQINRLTFSFQQTLPASGKHQITNCYSTTVSSRFPSGLAYFCRYLIDGFLSRPRDTEIHIFQSRFSFSQTERPSSRRLKKLIIPRNFQYFERPKPIITGEDNGYLWFLQHQQWLFDFPPSTSSSSLPSKIDPKILTN